MPEQGAPEQARAPQPPYRNLRVWAESFDLALDIFQVTRTLTGLEARTMTKRLIDSSSRMPVAVARGQASGSATEFIRCLHEGLSEMSELETHLLMCGQLGYLSVDQVRSFETRLMEIRRMTRGLIRRLRLPGQGARPPAKQVAETGSALLLAILVSAILGTIGVIYLQIATTEMRIAGRARDRDQLLAVAESGTLAVKAWFDTPVSGDPSDPAAVRHLFLGRFDLRDPAAFDRTRRLLDTDGDPSTSPVAADGSPGREFYRQGREILAGFPHLDLFGKPYRGSVATALMGPPEGPDIVLQDRAGVIDLLDEINAVLFPRQEETGRIERIEISGPQMEIAGPPAARLGVATVQVTAAKCRPMTIEAGVPVLAPSARCEGRAIVRMGLAEIPAGAPEGPLESCGDITATGSLRARWGRVTAEGDLRLSAPADELDSSVASGFPYASLSRHIQGMTSGDALADWLGDADPSVEDPWLNVVAGGRLIGYEGLPDQPFPYDLSRAIDRDHSNLFQRVAGVTCAAFDYDVWKRIALSGGPGGRGAHYLSFDSATGLFRENGSGPARSVRDWTDRQMGIFFFDTTDGERPNPGNLTPPIVISGGTWGTAGVIYLNAASFRADGAAGSPRVVLPPGEPFDDGNHDGLRDSAEPFVNLRYATEIGSGTSAGEFFKEIAAGSSVVAASPDGESYAVTTTLDRDGRGLPILAPVNLMGVLYTSGAFIAEGDAVYYGSVLAGGNVTQPSAPSDTPIILFDERLNTGLWPPPEIAVPRTFLTFWQTSRP